jgi:hypothetical protein
VKMIELKRIEERRRELVEKAQFIGKQTSKRFLPSLVAINITEWAHFLGEVIVCCVESMVTAGFSASGGVALENTSGQPNSNRYAESPSSVPKERSNQSRHCYTVQ